MGNHSTGLYTSRTRQAPRGAQPSPTQRVQPRQPLDQQPDNEARLIATGEVWQIAAFAELYADKIVKGLPKQADYARARRLYQACLALGVDNGYFEEKLAELERVWKEKGG